MAKILYISHTSNLSGAPISLMLLANEMKQRGHDVTFVSPKNGPLISQFNNCNLKMFFAEGKGFNKWFYSKNLYNFIKDKKFDIAHVNTSLATFGAKAAKEAGIPVIWHIREDLSRAEKKILKAIQKYSNLIISPSTDIKNFITKNIKIETDKVKIIPNGIDINKIMERLLTKTEVKRALNIPDDAAVIGMVGTIEPRKDPETYIKAASLAAASNNNVFFILMGNPLPGHEKHLKKSKDLAARLKLNDKFIFIKAGEDVMDIINAMDIFVLPSLWEGMPRVILEAMALAKPVITTNVGGNPEIVINNKTGLIVPPKSAESLAMAIKTLLDNEEESVRMGKNGQKSIYNNFSLKIHTDRIESLYKEII